MTDWPSFLRLAATRLHIPPDAFWRLSVKEWAALTGAPAAALGRGDLNTLMAAHPDVGGGGAPHPTLSPEGRGARCIRPLAPPGRGRGPRREAAWEGEGNRSTTP